MASTLTPAARTTLATQTHGRAALARAIVGRIALHCLLIGLSLVALAPIAWMLSTSLKPSGTEYEWPIRWFPERIMFGNYVTALTVMNFSVYYRNTFTIAILATLGTTLTSAMAGFAFARLRFVARGTLFVLVLSTMMRNRSGGRPKGVRMLKCPYGRAPDVVCRGSGRFAGGGRGLSRLSGQPDCRTSGASRVLGR